MRLLLLAVAISLPLMGAVWSVSATRLPPADFTFNNGTEIKTVDPALVTGSPEGRIINALFEGLVRLDPEHRMPTKEGTATGWTVSDDGLVYTFQLRQNARWSNGDPVTAEDYHYSLRRFLHPLTGAEYAYQAWYIRNGKRYTSGGGVLAPGDRVEVELHLAPEQHETCRGEMLRGTLVRKEPPQMPEDEEEAKKITQRFYVDVDCAEIDDADSDGVDSDGTERCFVMVNPRYGETVPEGATACRQVTLDFSEVGIQVLDPYTLEITLESPTPYWPQLLGFYPLYPVHRGCLEEHGAPAWTQPENIVTNGPYRMSFRRPQDRIRLVKSERYWNRDAVQLETIDALAVENQITSLNMYEKGLLDWAPGVPGNVVPDLMHSDPPREDFNPQPMLTVYYYRLNTTRPPLDDARVRRALALALNRQEIIDTVIQGPQTPALHLVPPGVKGYDSPTLGEEDTDEARRLLAAAGFAEGHGFPRLEILYNTNESHEAIAELLRKQWQKALGITVTLQNEAWSSYLDRMRLMRYDVGRAAWTGDYIDPNTFLDMFVTDGENNQTGWSNPEYDGLIAQARTVRDPAERLAVLRQAEAILMDQLPIVPVYFYVSQNLVRPHVRGFYNNLQDTHPLHYLWIDRSGESPNPFLTHRSTKRGTR